MPYKSQPQDLSGKKFVLGERWRLLGLKVAFRFLEDARDAILCMIEIHSKDWRRKDEPCLYHVPINVT